MEDVCHGEVASRAGVRQRKKKRLVSFEITPTTRRSLSAWIQKAGLKARRLRVPEPSDSGRPSEHTPVRSDREGLARIIGEDQLPGPVSLSEQTEADLAVTEEPAAERAPLFPSVTARSKRS